MSDDPTTQSPAPFTFKAETRQLLNILIHSLYTEREVFLRELISNASDALTRMDFEILTNRAVLDSGTELAIRVIPDPEKNTLTIMDSGIGMTSEELVENLGTIAHSGVREYITAAKDSGKSLTDFIGQFGVGFYSAFMVADSIKVVTRSFQPESQGAVWFSTGEDTFTVEPAEKVERGTRVILHLKSDATEFSQEYRLREIIRKHSDFIPFPIYIGDQKEQVNQRTALWRELPRQVEKTQYDEFYKQLTLDGEPPLTHTHMVVDAPVQMYALLFIPSSPERGMFSTRKDDGLKLFARKVLIQEYCKDLLPEYLRFVQGVVDSEDLPLNISRETIQSNRVMLQLKKLVTTKVLDTLKQLAKDEPESYSRFWKSYDRAIKQGVAIEQTEPETLFPLLRFHTTEKIDEWSSLDDYIQRMKTDQKHIYYIMGDDEHSLVYSPHLDVVRHHEYEVLLLTDPLDAFMLMRLTKYQDYALSNVATADLDLPKEEGKSTENVDLPPDNLVDLIQHFKDQLGDRVTDVRITQRLSDSPARLVDPQGVPAQEIQRVYHLLKQDIEVPKKILEINPQHKILVSLNALPRDDPRSTLIIEQIYENALLIEGLHTDPASMITRIQKIMEAALEVH